LLRGCSYAGESGMAGGELAGGGGSVGASNGEAQSCAGREAARARRAGLNRGPGLACLARTPGRAVTGLRPESWRRPARQRAGPDGLRTGRRRATAGRWTGLRRERD
jgi:hypothetical protein